MGTGPAWGPEERALPRSAVRGPVAARATVAALAVLAVALAGCNGDSDPTTTPVDEPRFDGQAAWGFAREVVERVLEDGAAEARPRHPGSPGHMEVARLLEERMAMPGWEVERQAFTGSEYLAMPKGAAQWYIDQAQYCTAAERQRVEGLSFVNLVARKAAAGGPEGGAPSMGTLVLAAHWDSKANASSETDAARKGLPVPAANDAASGVGILLQLQRHIAATELPFDVWVVLFDGEDGFEDCHPLAGSTAFVRKLASGAVDRMVLLDMVGDPDARFPRMQESLRCDPAFVGLLWGHAQRLGLEQFTDATSSVTDDHTPFLEAGIPAVDVIGFGADGRFLPYWHTTADTMENLDPAFMGQVGDMLVATLQDPSLATPWPQGCAP